MLCIERPSYRDDNHDGREKIVFHFWTIANKWGDSLLPLPIRKCTSDIKMMMSLQWKTILRIELGPFQFHYFLCAEIVCSICFLRHSATAIFVHVHDNRRRIVSQIHSEHQMAAIFRVRQCECCELSFRNLFGETAAMAAIKSVVILPYIYASEDTFLVFRLWFRRRRLSPSLSHSHTHIPSTISYFCWKEKSAEWIVAHILKSIDMPVECIE